MSEPEKPEKRDPYIVAGEYLRRVVWAKECLKNDNWGEAMALAGLVEALVRETAFSEEQCREFALDQVKAR